MTGQGPVNGLAGDCELSNCEKKILLQLARDKSTEEVISSVGIDAERYEKISDSLFKKLSITRQPQALMWAISQVEVASMLYECQPSMSQSIRLKKIQLTGSRLAAPIAWSLLPQSFDQDVMQSSEQAAVAS